VVKHSTACEANKCTDVLANIGFTFDFSGIYYDSCPIECSYVMQVDIMEITISRYINM
jgi:hypothetical protein